MFCKKCGKQMEENWSVCPECGEAIKESTITNVADNENNKKRKNQFLKDGGFG